MQVKRHIQSFCGFEERRETCCIKKVTAFCAVDEAANATKPFHATFQLFCRCFRLLQSEAGEHAKPIRMPLRCGIGLVVCVMDQAGGVLGRKALLSRRGERENLQIDTTFVHSCKTHLIKVKQLGLKRSGGSERRCEGRCGTQE